jgi:hypothetical protein
MSLRVIFFALLALICAASAGATLPSPALIQVETSSDIGILLNEYPAEALPRVISWSLSRPDSYWDEAVRRQLSLSLYKLLYRNLWYGSGAGKNSLPIPIEQLKITFTSAPERRNQQQGRDVIMRSYTMSGFIVTDVDSAAASDPNLGTVGGWCDENFVLPLDPYLTFQRTGYACMDEAQFPLDSVDSEGTMYFFDETCGGEAPYDFDGGCNQCHCTVPVMENCRSVLGKTTGKTSVNLKFTRVALNMTLVNQIEALATYQFTSTAGADMLGSIPSLNHNYVIYKYLTEDSCTQLECNGGGFGWRRLFYFDAVHVNVGTKPLEIGFLVYLQNDASSFDPLLFHNLYYWDTCHQHPHFTGYAEYKLGNTLGHKQGFCIMATGREINARWSPIVNQNYDCLHQGITQGWSDAYNAGIPCQWVDVTALNTNNNPVTQNLVMDSNHKNWLCEGVVNRDANGNVIWVPTGEFTSTGQPIEKQSCTTTPGALNNNHDVVSATIPTKGKGLITQACKEVNHYLGPNRDCELAIRSQTNACSAGNTVTLSCTVGANAKSQVLRVCEASVALQAGTACRFNDDFTLANVIVSPGAATQVSFTCPSARDAGEPGGLFATYSGPVWNFDSLSSISCSVV